MKEGFLPNQIAKKRDLRQRIFENSKNFGRFRGFLVKFQRQYSHESLVPKEKFWSWNEECVMSVVNLGIPPSKGDRPDRSFN